MFRHSQQPSNAANAESAVVGILGDEKAAATHASLAQLHLKVAALEEQMRSQFTAVAAYASIAQEQVEFTRNEARADLDRTRQTLIELVEQVRHEASPAPRTRVPGAPPGPLAPPIVTAPEPFPGRPTGRARTGDHAVLRPSARAGRNRGGRARHRLGRPDRRADQRPRVHLTTALPQLGRSAHELDAHAADIPGRIGSGAGSPPAPTLDGRSTASLPPATCGSCRRPQAVGG